MPKRSNLHQAVIYLAKRHLAPDGATVIESDMLRDADTGADNEVDIVIRGNYGDTPVVISIEVTRRGRPVDITWVNAMIKKHERMPTGPLYLVSWSGFTKNALLKIAAQGGRVVGLTPEILANATVSPLFYEEITPQPNAAALLIRNADRTLTRAIDVPMAGCLYAAEDQEEVVCTIGELVNRYLNVHGGGRRLVEMAHDGNDGNDGALNTFSIVMENLEEVVPYPLFVHHPERGFERVHSVSVAGPINWKRHEINFTAVKLGDRVFAFSEAEIAGRPAVWVVTPREDGSATASWQLL